ncbi:MAG: hypothetical protein ACO38I_09800 [Ilumatobacteraceae bacterium]
MNSPYLYSNHRHVIRGQNLGSLDAAALKVALMKGLAKKSTKALSDYYAATKDEIISPANISVSVSDLPFFDETNILVQSTIEIPKEVSSAIATDFGFGDDYASTAEAIHGIIRIEVGGGFDVKVGTTEYTALSAEGFGYRPAPGTVGDQNYFSGDDGSVVDWDRDTPPDPRSGQHTGNFAFDLFIEDQFVIRGSLGDTEESRAMFQGALAKLLVDNGVVKSARDVEITAVEEVPPGLTTVLDHPDNPPMVVQASGVATGGDGKEAPFVLVKTAGEDRLIADSFKMNKLLDETPLSIPAVGAVDQDRRAFR